MSALDDFFIGESAVAAHVAIESGIEQKWDEHWASEGEAVVAAYQRYGSGTSNSPSEIRAIMRGIWIEDNYKKIRDEALAEEVFSEPNVHMTKGSHHSDANKYISIILCCSNRY